MVQAEDDVFKFGEVCFGYHAYPHHRELIEFYDGCVRDGVDGLILEPRGFAKSTWGTTINLSHRIGREKDIRVGLFSKSEPHASAFSRGIRWTLERNEPYRAIFGDLVSDAKWTDAEWLRAESRWHGSQYSTLYAQGVGGQIVSKRFDIIHCDDILDGENTATREQMRKTEDWFWQTLYPTKAPDGVVIVIGTRWADGDLYQQLEEQGWRVLKRAAFVRGKRRKIESLWPDVWPLHKLLELQSPNKMGRARFACAMLNDITGLLEGDIFRQAWFRYVPALPAGEYTIRMGVDLATSTKQRADWTAQVTTAEDREGNFIVLNAERTKISSGHDRWVVDQWRKAIQMWGHVDAVAIEAVQHQAALVSQMLNEHPEVPVTKQNADGDKGTRASAVSTKYEAGKVVHLSHLKDSDFEIELLSFDRGHDDFVDSLGYSMQLVDRGTFVFGSVSR